GLRHPSTAAAWAEPSTLAAKRDELLGAAALAAHPKEALLEPPALQVRLELLLHVARQRLALRRSRLTEPGIVLGDDLVEQRLFGTMARVARRVDERRCALGTACRHRVRPCGWQWLKTLPARPLQRSPRISTNSTDSPPE